MTNNQIAENVAGEKSGMCEKVSRKTMGLAMVILSVVACVVVGALAVHTLRLKSDVQRISGGFSTHVGPSAETLRAKRQKEIATDEYRASVAREYEAFAAEVAEKAKSIDAVRARIPRVVGSFGFNKCCSLAWAVAKEKMSSKRGKSDFATCLYGELAEEFYKPLQEGRTNVLLTLNSYQDRLETHRRTYVRRLESIPGWDRAQLDPPTSLVQASADVEEICKKQLGAHFSAAAAVAIETAFLRAGLASSARLLQYAAARLAASGGAAAVSAAADGPLPIGDIIGVGCLLAGGLSAVSAVYDAVSVIPKELSKVLNEVVTRQRNEVVSLALSEAGKLKAAYLSAVR